MAVTVTITCNPGEFGIPASSLNWKLLSRPRSAKQEEDARGDIQPKVPRHIGSTSEVTVARGRASPQEVWEPSRAVSAHTLTVLPEHCVSKVETLLLSPLQLLSSPRGESSLCPSQDNWDSKSEDVVAVVHSARGPAAKLLEYQCVSTVIGLSFSQVTPTVPFSKVANMPQAARIWRGSGIS